LLGLISTGCACASDLLVHVNQVGLPSVVLVERVRIQFNAKLRQPAEYSG
jgi:hypothetical protein